MRSASRWPKNSVRSRGCGVPGKQSGSSMSSAATDGLLRGFVLGFLDARQRQPRRDGGPDAFLDDIGGAARVDENATLGLPLGDVAKRLPELAMKLHIFHFKAVRRLVALRAPLR